MIIEKCNRTKSVILVIASVLILGLLSTNAQAGKNYNSSKSNTTTVAGQQHVSTLDRIRTDIEKQGIGINEEGIQSILRKHGIKGIKKIVIQRMGNRVEVLLLSDLSDLPKARSAVKPIGVPKHSAGSDCCKDCSGTCVKSDGSCFCYEELPPMEIKELPPMKIRRK